MPAMNRNPPTIAPHLRTLPAMWFTRSQPDVSRSLILPFLPDPSPFSGFTAPPLVVVLDRALTARRLARHTVADDVRLDEMVPAARLAHLENVDPDLAVLVRHLLDVAAGLDPPGVLAELLAEDVVEMGHLALAAHRARRLDGLAVVLGRQHRVGVRVADVVHRRSAAVEQRRELGSALQRVVDDRPLGPHDDFEGTASPGCCFKSGSRGSRLIRDQDRSPGACECDVSTPRLAHERVAD